MCKIGSFGANFIKGEAVDTDKFLSEIWGGLKLFLDPKTQITADERNLAVLLAADAENFDRFMALKEFRDILHALGLKADIYSLQCAQLGAINALKSAKISKSKLLAALEILQNENIISAAHFEELATFLRGLGADLPVGSRQDGANFKKSDVFHQKIDALNDVCDRILSLKPSAAVASMAAKARQKARELEFNVAVTGVINAGKSTLLNALLGEKILGASNVPETVNLTVLKYAPKPFAKVNFWSAAELAELGIARDGEAAEIYADLLTKEGEFGGKFGSGCDKFDADPNSGVRQNLSVADESNNDKFDAGGSERKRNLGGGGSACDDKIQGAKFEGNGDETSAQNGKFDADSDEAKFKGSVSGCKGVGQTDDAELPNAAQKIEKNQTQKNQAEPQNLSGKFNSDDVKFEAKFEKLGTSDARQNLTAESDVKSDKFDETPEPQTPESIEAQTQDTEALNLTRETKERPSQNEALNLTQEIKEQSSQKLTQINELVASQISPTRPVNTAVPASKTVKTDEIKRYTSADSKYAKFVKSVELYENLELLRDNVRIIDTPGIDDAVALREELVRRFMEGCDLMVHLMNVSQSATQKDLDFIVASLKNSHAVRLAVLLTHADVLKQGELNEVAAYAKKSVGEHIKVLGIGVEFFAVSAKSYFEGAQNSGVEEFKQFLYETLFGPGSQKSRLGIEAYKKELGRVCAQFAADTQAQILNLTGSNLSLSQRLAELNEQKAALARRLEEVTEAVKEELERLDTAETAASYELGLKSIAQTLKQRVADDANYSAAKKQKADPQRLARIAQTAIRDGVAALMRQNRNEIVRQIAACKQNVALKFGELDVASAPREQKVFSVSDYLSANGISLECAEVCEKIINASKAGARDISSVAKEAAEEFLSTERIKNFIFELSELEKSEFKKEIAAALKSKEAALASSEEALKNELAALAQSSGEGAARLERLSSQSEAIKALNLELQNV